MLLCAKSDQITENSGPALIPIEHWVEEDWESSIPHKESHIAPTKTATERKRDPKTND